MTISDDVGALRAAASSPSRYWWVGGRGAIARVLDELARLQVKPPPVTAWRKPDDRPDGLSFRMVLVYHGVRAVDPGDPRPGKIISLGFWNGVRWILDRPFPVDTADVLAWHYLPDPPTIAWALGVVS